MLLSAACLLAALAAYAYYGPEQLLQFAVGPRLQDAGVFSLDSLAGRLEIWSRAIYAIQDFPLTGVGGQPGFGWKQMAGAGLGAVLALAGGFLIYRK